MFYLALKQLLARPIQTILALFAIALGSAAFLILSGMMLGFREYLIQRLINTTAHVSIKAEEPTIEEHSLDPYFFPDTLVKWIVSPVIHNEPPHIEYPQGWFDRLDADPNVLAYAPQITTQVMVNRGKLTRSIILIGVEAQKQVLATDVQDDMTVGNFLELDRGGFQVVIGESLAQKLGIHVNDTLNIVEIGGAMVPAKVVGFFSTGMTQVDDVTAYAPIHYVQQANQTPGQVAQIIVKLKDITLARKVADQWASISREKVQSWDEANANFFQVFKMQDMIRYILSFVVLVIAGFVIYIVLNMVVMQKRGEIAILRSMGYEAGDIIQLFLSQGLILGFIGGIIGMGLGTLVCLYVQTITFGSGMGVTKINHMLIAWHGYFYVIAFCMAFFSGMLAGFFPSWKASRMNPIDILRAEGG